MDQRISQLVKFENLQKSPVSITAEMVVDEKLPSFEGHFPGNPILPAVSIIDISLYLLAQEYKEVSHTNIQLKRSKFMAMVRPNQEVELSAESDDEGKNWRVTWVLKENQSKLAQVHLII
ncbi:MAG: hypothetical protein AAF203_07865 [Pseudomonadota bacterium]